MLIVTERRRLAASYWYSVSPSGGGNGGQQAKLVVSVRLDLLARLVCRQHVVGLVIGAANQSVSCSVIRNFL